MTRAYSQEIGRRREPTWPRWPACSNFPPLTEVRLVRIIVCMYVYTYWYCVYHFFATYYILLLPGSMTHSDDKWPKKSNSYVVGFFLFSMENRCALWKPRIVKINSVQPLWAFKWCLTNKSEILFEFSNVFHAFFEFQNEKSLGKIQYKTPYC